MSRVPMLVAAAGLALLTGCDAGDRILAPAAPARSAVQASETIQEGRRLFVPEGRTASEKRGRLFFIDTPSAPGQKQGACAFCHSGPMLNAANRFAFPDFRSPEGVKVNTALVAEANTMGNPTYTFLVDPRVRRGADGDHARSAKTLREVVDHYADVFFNVFTIGGERITLTEQDREDIVAFLRTL